MEAMQQADIAIPDLQARDGLAIINGSNLLTAMSALNLYDMNRFLKQAEIACAISLEALLANMKPYDDRLHKLRGFSGAIRSANAIQKCVTGSDLQTGKVKTKVQDAYSMRSSPQVIGAAHDALKVNYINKGWAIELVSAWNQSSQNKFGTDYAFSTSFYKSLNIFRISKKFNKFSIASFNISDGFQDLSNPEKQHFRFTYGLIPNYQNDKFRITARGFVQTGKLQSGQNVNAFYTNLEFSYSVSKKIKLTAGNEIKSGNNGLDSLNTTDHAFDILYGAKHKFNGRIDYFSLPSTTKGTGFIDTYLKTRFNVMKYASLSAEYHYFMLENNYVYNGSVIDKFLGNEIDLVYKQDFGKNIALEAGYSFFLGTESAEIIKGGNKDLWNHWFYMMITIDPTFFISKN